MRLFGIFFCFLFTTVFSQNALKPFQWRSHLSYKRALSLAEYNGKIYCAVTSVAPPSNPNAIQTHQGIYYYDKNDQSFGTLSKIEGLSDVDPIILRTNPYNNTLMIIYQNTNIDVLQNDQVINISDIKRKNILGSKQINNVHFRNELAYLATSLGIIVVNTNNGEVKDTYYIGNGGTYLNTYEITSDANNLYAATENGVYVASLSATNLSDYQSWVKVTSLPVGPYNCIVNFKGTILTNFSYYIQSNYTALYSDTLYSFNGVNWQKYPYKPHDPSSYSIRKLLPYDNLNRLIILDQNTLEVRDDAGTAYTRTWAINGYPYSDFRDAIPDANSGYYWVADQTFGLFKMFTDNSNFVSSIFQKFNYSSPEQFIGSDLKILENNLYVAPTPLGDYPSSSYFQYGVCKYENENGWKEIKKHTGGLYFDINSVCLDADNKDHFYAGSYGSGVHEILNDSVINIYNNSNSSLPLAIGIPSGVDTRVTDVMLDEDKTLWVAAAYTNYPLTARSQNGTWHSLFFNNSSSTGVITDNLIMDKNKQVWLSTANNNGILVYKHDGSFNQPAIGINYIKLTISDTGNGTANTASYFYSMVEDKEGDLWIGTDKGIFVFYSPESVITDPSARKPQQILVEVNGVTQILLESESIISIAVDGANNKWIGTRKSGVFCISPDGQKELYHFTSENSPLFSNNIIDIAIHPKTGEVFIATDKGIISFQNTVLEGFETFTDVYAYPNPVKPGYTGPVLIKGLIDQSSFKIVDVNGNLVYEGKAGGGQATWYAKNFKGERVASGVYIVFCATSDGTQKALTKILVIN